MESDSSLSFVIQRHKLFGLLDVSALMISRDIVPVLNNFKINVSETALRVVTTNLAMTAICTTTEVNVRIPGTAYFPVRKLLDIVKQCDIEISILVENQIATISSGSTVWTLKLSAGVGYPKIPDMSDLVIKEISTSDFMLAVGTVKYAAAATTTLARDMNAILIEKNVTAACDGIRMHRVSWNAPFERVVLPLDAVDDIFKLVRSHSTMKFGTSETHLLFQAGSNVLIINKLSHDFPSVEGSLSGPAMRNKDMFSVKTEDLEDAVNAVRLSADPDLPAIVINVSSDVLTLAASGFYGSAVSSVNVKEFGNMETANKKTQLKQLKLNHRFLLQALNAMDCEFVEFYIPDDVKKKLPILINNTESGAFAVLSQMI